MTESVSNDTENAASHIWTMDASLRVSRDQPYTLPTPIASELSGPVALEHSWTRRSHNKNNLLVPILLCHGTTVVRLTTFHLLTGLNSGPCRYVLASDNAYTKYDLELLHHFPTTVSQYFKVLRSDDILSSQAVLAKDTHWCCTPCLRFGRVICKSIYNPRPGLQKVVLSFNDVREAESVLTTSMINTYGYTVLVVMDPADTDLFEELKQKALSADRTISRDQVEYCGQYFIFFVSAGLQNLLDEYKASSRRMARSGTSEFKACQTESMRGTIIEEDEIET
ncbi:hypothetical protein P171DRAFT_523979 [Karstenula rhodostoma CBS 690.94]|uniref:Uncharacterized protein n=1 Tax=Karstenula rhodostoma CBS 690.94 TaxID=1392251 RepID=A0A9P4P9P3_9PLEO|nr:hypothetical protein P171DRAFT_523979 [Karstenula rhodostoma CBS 690.94]